MKYRKILRRRDAPHIFYGWTERRARRMDVYYEAWLDTETGTLVDQIPEEAPKPKAVRKPRRKPAPKKAAPPEPEDTSLDDVAANLEGLG